MERQKYDKLLHGEHDPIFSLAKESSTQEAVFMIQTGSRLIPIAAKAGAYTKSHSLSGFIKVDHAG